MEKLQTWINGFDLISYNGIPKNRTTLVAGSSGSAKTVFAVQYLAEGILNAGDSGVFVTFEESPQDIRNNMIGFGWDIEKWELEGKWIFVDGSLQPDDDSIIAGKYDLVALLARIEYAVKKIGAKRLSMDSIGAFFAQFKDIGIIRKELFRISIALRAFDVTSILTAERTQEYGNITRYDVEEFVADNVIILRNVLQEEKRRRTIEILKFRGAPHQKGEFPFTISAEEGITVIPLSAIQLKQKSSDIRVTSGNEDLDRMCGGGFFRDSIILVSGATGTGKTLIVTEFMDGGVKSGMKCLLFAFEESREQLYRNAIGWGVDFEKMEYEGKLKIICDYPEVTNLEDHLISMKSEIKNFKPHRLAVDSLSALERISTTKGFREFVIDLTSFIKQEEITGIFTSNTPTLLGGTSITETHISTITDSIILLRYVEMYGEMKRGITVLKMRGSMHDKNIFEFNIDSNGMHISKPFRNITGIIAGHPTLVSHDEANRLGDMFPE
ncbi:circadian clock protein KaiC [Candidatus Magnetoovum chiemensis]|nr:circadian clock protein KaiC [Candidatus Magnetoovum chiemensis]